MQSTKAALSLFFTLLTVVFVVGCGSASLTGDQADRRDPAPPGQTQIQMAMNGHLTCAFTGECEPALAMLSVATSDGVDRCTAFLISDHELLTNDHCLNTISRSTSCEGLVFAHFNGDVHRGCKRISVRSGQTGLDSKDYAVIELDTPVRDRIALSVSRRGFKANEMGTVHRVQMTQNPQTKNYDGIQTRANCQATFNSIMDVSISSQHDPLMTFGDCSIQAGNSGSPILNEDGEVGAVIQGFLAVKDQNFSLQLQPYLLDESYGQVAMGTQTTCMQEIVGNIAGFCNEIKPLAGLWPNDYISQYGKFSEKKILPLLSAGETWRNLPPRTDAQLNYFTAPSCVHAEEAENERFSFTSVVMSYHLGINARLQAEWRPISKMGGKQTLFEIEKSSGRPSLVKFFSAEFGMMTLPVCPR